MRLPAQALAGLGVGGRRMLASAVIVAVATGIGLTLMNSAPAKRLAINLRVTPDERACCEMGVRVNESPRETRLKLIPGVVTQATIPFRGKELSRLELSFDIPAGSRVRMEKVNLLHGGEVVGQVTKADLHAFARERALPAEIDRHYVVYTAERDNPIVSKSMSIPATSNSVIRWWWGARRDRFLLYLMAVALLIPVAAIAGGGGARRRTLTIAALLVLVAASRSLESLAGSAGRDTARSAVGASAYFGKWKVAETRLHLAMIASALVIGGVLGALVVAWMRRRKTEQSQSAEPVIAPEGGDVGRTTVLVRAALFALLAIPIARLIPNLHTAIDHGMNHKIPASWDAANVVYWDYLVAHGSRPLRDFWYPYGLQYYLTKGVPWGLYLTALVDSLAWVFVGWGTWLVVRGRSSAALRFAIVMGGLALGIAAIDGGYRPERHMFGLAILMLYAGIKIQGESIYSRGGLSVAVLIALLMEPAQVIYALPGLGIVFLFAIGSELRESRAKAVSQVVRDGLNFGVPLIGAIALLLIRDQLRATIDFYAEIQSLATYASIPSDLRVWIRRPTDQAGLLYWLGVVPVCLGALSVWSRSAKRRLEGALILGVGLLGCLVLQKQVTRSGLPFSPWVPVVCGSLLWIAFTDRVSMPSMQVVSGGVAGAMIVLVAVPSAQRPLEELVASPGRVATAIELVTRKERIDALNATRFSRARFENFPEYSKVASAVRAQIRQPEDRLWVMGDDPLLNVLANEREPYYFSNAYDVSPIRSQRRLVGQLKADPPDLVAWRPAAGAVDGVPYFVRDPLIYAWAASELLPVESVGGFELLRTRQPDEPPAQAWWTEKLGPRVNLGMLMAIATVSEEPCTTRAGACDKYVEVSFDETQTPPPAAEFVLTVADQQYVIRFDSTPGVKRYVVNLNRVWFWNAGGPNAPRSVDSPIAGGGRVRVFDRRTDEDVLY